MPLTRGHPRWLTRGHSKFKVSSVSLWAPEKGLKVSEGKGIYEIDRCIYTHDKNLSNSKMTVSATFKISKCEIFLWSWWPWKQGQGQTYDMQYKVLPLGILGINIMSLTQMVTDTVHSRYYTMYRVHEAMPWFNWFVKYAFHDGRLLYYHPGDVPIRSTFKT